MAVLKAERFTALKAKVKAEMLRRNQSGSVAAYGGTAYDYTVKPAAGKVLLQEHLDKLSVPMSAVNNTSIPGKTGKRVISEAELSAMEAKVAAWAARSITDTSGSDCKSGCTGACYTGCATGCTGCGSGCPTGCSGCGSGCPDGCSGCGRGCADSCDGCGFGCADDCDGCGSGCPTGCSGCGSGCPDGCSSCGAACSDGCTDMCTSACISDCTNSCRNAVSMN